MLLRCYMSLYTIVLRKIDTCLVKKQLESRQDSWERQWLGNRGLTLCLDKKTTIYGLEAGKIVFFGNMYHGIHSNAFLYFTDLPVSSSLYRLYSSRAGLCTSL